VAGQPTAAQAALAIRLRELRRELLPGRAVAQRHVADALGASVALVSSWENPSIPTVPPEDRLKQYAHFLATERSIDESDQGRLVDDLTTEEESRRRALIDELIRMREEALQDDVAPSRATGALGGRFWYFPDGQPIRIITNRLSRRALTSVSARTPDAKSNDPGAHDPVPYANPWHPNYIESLWDGDRDATIELFGHIRAENPGADVRFLTYDRTGHNDLTGHVVILGQADVAFGSTPSFSTFDYMLRRLELPWRTRLPAGADDEFDSEFIVTMDDEGVPTYYEGGDKPARVDVYRPTFLREDVDSRPRRMRDGYPQLEYDVAVLARRPNQLNLSASVTICCGIFSRGTYGAVRTLTDSRLRTRNEQWLSEHVDPDDFWLLFQVPVFQNPDGAETVTPDLERPFHRLRASDRRLPPF
jgi:transcriptional regulator with XRE-family HTH domain